MFKIPFSRGIPVEIAHCGLEGEPPGCKSVTVRRSDIHEKNLTFILRDKDIIAGSRILVRVVKKNKRTTLVEPLANYVPFFWGMNGKTPTKFRVASDCISPE